MRVHADQSSLFGYYSPATGEVTSHPPLCACGRCSMPVETFEVTGTAPDCAAVLSGVQIEENN